MYGACWTTVNAVLHVLPFFRLLSGKAGWEDACLGDFALGSLLSVRFLACALVSTRQDGAWRGRVTPFSLSEEFPSVGYTINCEEKLTLISEKLWTGNLNTTFVSSGSVSHPRRL